ncbi:DUF6612 family protein [Chloroflexota bacterium]
MKLKVKISATIIKLYLVVIIIITTFIAVIGCNDTENKSLPLPAAEEIINRHAAASEKITSCRSQVTMIMDIAVSARKNDILSMSLYTKGAVDLPGKKLEMDASISTELRGESTSYKTKVYLIDNTLYTSDKESQDEGSQWRIKSLSGEETNAVWQEQADMLSASRYLNMFAASESIASRLVQKDGITCYLIEMTPDPEVLNEQMKDLISRFDSSAKTLPFDNLDIFESTKVSFWIDADTYNMVRYEIAAELTFEDNGRTLKGYIENVSRFYDFDAELFIKAPD